MHAPLKPDAVTAGPQGAGVNVGVFELERNRTSDIAAYQSCYGTSTSVSYMEEEVHVPRPRQGWRYAWASCARPADQDVDATNWRAEQGIRPAVVNRKVCGGNRSDRGAVAQGIMMSVIRTAAQHGVDAIGYLASRARSPDPGLAILLG